MDKSYFIAVSLVLSLFAATGFAYSAKDSSTADAALTKILKAVENIDYNNFVADGDNQFKASLTKQMFEGVSAVIAPRMKKGNKVLPLGTLNQQSYKVHLWKLVFKDGGDDLLTKLVLHDSKVIGFWFQ